jgi:tetratricopeptide (TPR) repeat protein
LLPFYMVQADALAGRGELDRAERLLENERRKPARTDRKAEEQRAGLLLRLGRIKLRQGTPALAADHCRDAMRTLEARMGKDHPVLIDALDCVGRVELATGVLDSAKMHLERALALAESKIGADSLAAAEMLVSVAELMRRQNDHTGAFARLERATRVFESQRIDPMWLVSARFALAQVAREMPLHALEADELGRKALASVPDTARGRQERKAIEIFLARRGK